MRKTLNQKGFTLIEILMVVLLISILAAIGITQFKDFSSETRNSATKANLQVIRNGISQQYAQSRLRCSQTGTSWPGASSINSNDITSVGTYGTVYGSALCTTLQVTTPSDRLFVNGTFPVNPWGGSTSGPINKVYDCVVDGSGTAPSTGACSAANHLDCSGGGAFVSTSDGWCYNATTGQIWANSARNDGNNTGTGSEYLY